MAMEGWQGNRFLLGKVRVHRLPEGGCMNDYIWSEEGDKEMTSGAAQDRMCTVCRPRASLTDCFMNLGESVRKFQIDFLGGANVG